MCFGIPKARTLQACRWCLFLFWKQTGYFENDSVSQSLSIFPVFAYFYKHQIEAERNSMCLVLVPSASAWRLVPSAFCLVPTIVLPRRAYSSTACCLMPSGPFCLQQERMQKADPEGRQA